jgi:transposase
MARLFYWKKRLAKSAAPATFVEVRASALERHHIEIVRDDIIIRIREDIEVERLSRIVEALRQRSAPRMLTLPPGARVMVATARVDGRKGIDGLSALVRSQFTLDPLSGTMFVFFTLRADRVRVFYWDRDGYILVTKRLEKGIYRLPWPAEQGRVVIEAAELLLVFEGIELRGARRRTR